RIQHRLRPDRHRQRRDHPKRGHRARSTASLGPGRGRGAHRCARRREGRPLHGRTAARSQRPVHDRHGEQDALCWAGMRLKRVKLLVVLSALLAVAAQAASGGEDVQRRLYAVNQSAKDRGSISVYDIDAGHRLIKTIPAVPNVRNIRGVTASAVTGRLYVAYLDRTDTGMIYCLNVSDDTVVWN